jgi:hypothetical protein
MNKKTVIIVAGVLLAIALWAKFAKPVQWQRQDENLGF